MHLTIATLILAAAPVAPTSDGNVVYRCDFGTTCDRDYDRWPDGWTRRRGRNYPLYQSIRLEDEPAESGENNTFLRARLDGGAVAVFSPPQEISAEAAYLLEALVRPLGLQFDAVTLSLTFADYDLKPIETIRSEVVTNGSGWQSVRIGPARAPPSPARFAIIGLHVDPTRDADLSGTVDLDEVRLLRSPQLELSTLRPDHLFTRSGDVVIYGQVGRSAISATDVELVLTDAYGEILEQTTLPITGDDGGPGGDQSPQASAEGRLEWKPKVPGWGFFRVQARLAIDPETTIDQTLQFAVLPPLEAPAHGEFGWSMPSSQPSIPSAQLVDILTHAGIHWLKWPVSAAQLSADEALADEWNSFAERLQDRGIRLVGVLDAGQNLASSPSDASLNLVAACFLDAQQWKPTVDTVLTALSQRVRWWQLGTDDDASLADLPDLDTTLRDVRQHFRTFGGDLAIGLAWPEGRAYSKSGAVPWDFMSCGGSPEIDAIPVDRRERDTWHHWYLLNLPPEQDSLEERIRTLVFRMVAAKIIGAHGIFAAHPLGPHGLVRENGQPGELFLPWRTTSFLLGDAQFIGSLPMATNSPNYVFRRGRQVVMVVWNDRPTREIISLGTNVKQFDVWGRPVTASETSSQSNSYLIQPEPSFLVGLDSDLVDWSRDCVLQSQRLESLVGREQVIHLDFRNPFTHQVRGILQIHPPDQWSLSPQETSFSLKPGEVRSQPLTISLGSDTPGGLQSLRLDFQLEGNPSVQFSLVRGLEIGLSNLSVNATTQLDSEDNLLVEVVLNNHRDSPHSYRCTLFATGRPRVRRDHWEMPPGETSMTFVMPRGKDLIGQTLWLRTEELDGAALLNTPLIASPSATEK